METQAWLRTEQLVETLLGCAAKGYELQRYLAGEPDLSRETLFRLRGKKASAKPMRKTLTAIARAIAHADGPFRKCVSAEVLQHQRAFGPIAQAACLDYLEGRSHGLPNWENIALNAVATSQIDLLRAWKLDQDELRLELKRVCHQLRAKGADPAFFESQQEGDRMRCIVSGASHRFDPWVWDYVRAYYYSMQFWVEREAREERIGTCVLSTSVAPRGLWRWLISGNSMMKTRLLEMYTLRATVLQSDFLRSRRLSRLVVMFCERDTRVFLQRLTPEQRTEYFKHLQLLTQAGMELKMIEQHRVMSAEEAKLFSMAFTIDGMATADQLMVKGPERSFIVTDWRSQDYRTRRELFAEYETVAVPIDGFELQQHYRA